MSATTNTLRTGYPRFADRIPVVRVFNKIDRIAQPARVQRDDTGQPLNVSVSARTGEGVEELREAISDLLAAERIDRWIELQARDGRLRAQLFELGVVSEERIAENGSWIMHVDVPRETAERLGRLPGKDGEIVREQLLA